MTRQRRVPQSRLLLRRGRRGRGVLAAEYKAAHNEIFNLTHGEGRQIRKLARVDTDLVPGTETYEEDRAIYRPNRGALDISKVRNLLGYDPEHSLEEGMAKYHKFVTETDFSPYLNQPV